MRARFFDWLMRDTPPAGHTHPTLPSQQEANAVRTFPPISNRFSKPILSESIDTTVLRSFQRKSDKNWLYFASLRCCSDLVSNVLRRPYSSIRHSKPTSEPTSNRFSKPILSESIDTTVLRSFQRKSDKNWLYFASLRCCSDLVSNVLRRPYSSIRHSQANKWANTIVILRGERCSDFSTNI